MRKIHAVLRQFYELKRSQRDISRSLEIGRGTVANYLVRARNAGLSWPLPPEIDERALELALFPERSTTDAQVKFVAPDFAAVYLDLKSVGMTKQLAWEEYCQVHSTNSYSYSQFCHRYRKWLGRQQRSMRQNHIAGEKVFIDYCGPTVPVVDMHTGEYINAQIFVAVLGASNYTFACASASQKEADWIDAHTKAAMFFGGWATLTIPDNLKSGVTKTDRYVPVLNASYEQWSEHYRTAIIPARPYKPYAQYLVMRTYSSFQAGKCLLKPNQIDVTPHNFNVSLLNGGNFATANSGLPCYIHTSHLLSHLNVYSPHLALLILMAIPTGLSHVTTQQRLLSFIYLAFYRLSNGFLSMTHL